jgi:hypothetical protein
MTTHILDRIQFILFALCFIWCSFYFAKDLKLYAVLLFIGGVLCMIGAFT